MALSSRRNQLFRSLTSAGHPVRRFRFWREKIIETGLFLCALSSVFVTLSIVGILIVESLPFFKTVSVKDFLTDTQWTPLFSDAHFGVLPLLCGTFLATAVALIVAVPLGLMIAIYLNEYASARTREGLKPVLEILAAVPSVVYGYFALMFISPLLQKFLPELSGFNVLSAGLVMGVMITPYVSSLTEDAMRAVPTHLREGSYAMGATRAQTAIRVVIPSAISGVIAGLVLAVSRAVGETMVVSIAAGAQPTVTLNPLNPAQTITAFIVQVSQGDLPHGSIGYQSIYVVGLTLILITLVFNVIGFWVRRRFQRMVA